MKARLVPLYFEPGRDEEFDLQLTRLQELLADEANILTSQALGTALPPDLDAVIFPQLLGEAYRQVDHFQSIQVPILIVTSEFGTVSMWDWEIASYLRAAGVQTITPHSLDQAKQACRAIGLKRQLSQSKLLVFQDNPGAGFQASIFKRFYWWEDECTQRITGKFGIKIVRKSYRMLAEKARTIPDRQADEAWQKRSIAMDGVSTPALLSALKMFLAVKQEIENEGDALAVGMNCLNESHFSDTTPCLAWNLLYEEEGLLWGCEADTVSMLTKVILYQPLCTPLMMSNLYPFLMGQAALKHEHIPEFPDVEDPENHILIAHCGYLGVLPESLATEWTLKPKVLAIVPDNATAIDARLPPGPITLVKLGPTLETLTVVESMLEGYIQYPDSHCLNGAIVRVPDGRRLLREVDSHHFILVQGHVRTEIETIAEVFQLKVGSFSSM